MIVPHLGLVACLSLGAPPVLFVDNDAPPGGDGMSWARAFDDLSVALVAAPAQSELRIARGVYVPSGPGEDRHATFRPKQGQVLVGGYAGLGAPNPDERNIEVHKTILSGDVAGDDQPNFANRGDNVYHVVTIRGLVDHPVTIDGVTITGGNANQEWTPATTDQYHGGGVHLVEAELVILHSTVRGNISLYNGAGIAARDGVLTMMHCLAIDNGGSAVSVGDGACSMVECRFEGNSAIQGGGLFAAGSDASISGCTFVDNATGADGAISSINGGHLCVRDTLFSGNSSRGGAGAVYCFRLDDAEFENCVFVDNSGVEGGAILGFDTDMTITSCDFRGNIAERGGAVLHRGTPPPHQLTIMNCVFTGNIATGDWQIGHGGALAAWEGRVVNCSFAFNTARRAGAVAFEGDVHNSVFWANFGSDRNSQLHARSVSHSIIQGGWTGQGGNNRSDDPRFVDARGPDGVAGTLDDDLRLLPRSPGIDAADNTALPKGGVDLDGFPRFADDPSTPDTGIGLPPIADIGAYEFRLGDLDDDGIVTALDLLILLATWGPCPPCPPDTPCRADLNADGAVNALDALLLMSNWT